MMMTFAESNFYAPYALRRCGHVTLTGVALLWLLTGVALFRNSILEPPPPNPATLQSKIDPNTAPWWELTVLPRIGEVMARRIVAYRESAGSLSNFKSAADLSSVRGIGPKTLLRIGPQLRWDHP